MNRHLQRIFQLLVAIALVSSTVALISASPTPAAAQSSDSGGGYWMLESSGDVHAFGGASDMGDAVGRGGVDIEPTASGNGYWILDAAGRVSSHGDALLFGQATNIGPDDRAAALSSTPTGNGYWVFTVLGRAFAFGDAVHFGDLSGVPLNGPIVESQATPTGDGYYMVGSDGGIFSFGDASFYGSMGGQSLNQPIVGIAPTSSNGGYWLVASDGGVFAFGDATFEGSMGGTPLNQPMQGIVASGDAYLMVAADGGIFAFGNVEFHGSLGGNPPPTPVVSVAPLDSAPAVTGSDITADLDAWPATEPDSDAALEEVGRPAPPDGFRACLTERRVQVRTPEDLVLLDPSNAELWPGALIQGATYTSPASTQLRELDIDERSPLDLRVNFLREQNSDIVARPTGSTVGSAVGALIDDAERSGFKPGFETMRYEKRENHSLEQTAFHLGIDARYLTSSVSADLDRRRSVEERTVTAFFLEEAFTVTADLPGDPNELFTDAFDDADLDRLRRNGDLGPDNQPVFVQQVTYGRILTYSVTARESVEEIRAAIDAHYGTRRAGVDGEMTDEQRRIIREGSLEVLAIGGPREAVSKVLTGGDLSEYFTVEAPLTSYKPVAYTLVQIDPSALGDPARVSQETEFEATECEAKEVVGHRYRLAVTHLTVHNAACARNEAFEGDPDIYYNMDLRIDGRLGPRLIHRVAANRQTVDEGQRVALNGSRDTNRPREFVVRTGSTSQIQISGGVTDYDSTSANDLMGTFFTDLYNSPTPAEGVGIGARSTRFGNSRCSLTVEYVITDLGPVLE